MVTKVKRISINALEKVISENVGEPVVTREWNDLQIVIKHRLCLKEVMSFVDGIVKSCFDDDGTYLPEILDFATRCSVLETYANLSLPRNVEDKYQLVYAFDGYDMILKEIDATQWNAMMVAINKKIEHLASANISAITSQFNDLYSSIGSLEERISEVFNGIDGDTMKNLVVAMADGKLDEDKLVQAYMKAKNDDENAGNDPVLKPVE